MSEHFSADERLAVMDLIADYAFKLESGDLDGYVDNFTPDGVFEAASARCEGRSAIRSLVAHLYAIGQDGPGGNRHILGLPRIAATADGCSAHTYVMIPGGVGENSVSIAAIVQYVDRIVMHDGRWRFAHRRLDPVLRRAGRAGAPAATPPIVPPRSQELS